MDRQPMDWSQDIQTFVTVCFCVILDSLFRWPSLSVFGPSGLLVPSLGGITRTVAAYWPDDMFPSLSPGIGVPIMLAYVYGVVPISLCRGGGCGVSTANGKGVKIEFDEDDGPITGKERIFISIWLYRTKVSRIEHIFTERLSLDFFG